MRNLLNYNQFSAVYEAEGTESTPVEIQVVPVVDKKTGEPTDDIISLIDMLKDVDKAGEKVEESDVYEQAAPNPFKPVRIGETSDRVKVIQKYLGITDDGAFGAGTKKAIEKFQTENKLTVDGIVGEQTYGKMVELKLNIKDKTEIQKKIDEFKKMTEQAKAIVDSIIKDPRFYDCFESVSIVIVDGQTRVVCIPKKDAKEKIAGIKKDGLLTSNFSWLERVGEAVGKAIVFTIAGPIIIAVELAKAIVSGAISAGKFVAKEGMSVINNAFHGVSQISKWVAQKGVEIYATAKAEGQALWKKICEGFAKAAKTSKEAFIAFAGAASSALGTANEALKNTAYVALGLGAKAAGLAWEGLKTLDAAVREGVKSLAAKGAEAAKSFKNSVTAGYNDAKESIIKTAGEIQAGGKKLGNKALKAIGDGVKYAGDQISSFGSWISGLAESLFLETGDPIFEELIF